MAPKKWNKGKNKDIRDFFKGLPKPVVPKKQAVEDEAIHKKERLVSPISISDSDNEDNGQKELDILVQSLESPAEEDEPVKEGKATYRPWGPKPLTRLSGLSFVFTGQFAKFSPKDVVETVEKLGGCVRDSPTLNGCFVVVGDDIERNQLTTVYKYHLSTLSEDDFLSLLQSEWVEPPVPKVSEDSSQEHCLWTTRYAPQSLDQICGNKEQVKKLLKWLEDWPKSLRSGFKKSRESGMSEFRAVLISGPPGIGKTTSAHLCARAAGLTVVELNASDTRSRKLIKNMINVNYVSIEGYLTNSLGWSIPKGSCLIMDEVDGMSSGDWGGVGAMTELVKITNIPIICIANEGEAPKLKALRSKAFLVRFFSPPIEKIRSRILSILWKEKMDIPTAVVDKLVYGARSDIRQVLMMLEMWNLGQKSMDMKDSGALVKGKDSPSKTLFDVIDKLLGPRLFSYESQKKGVTLDEKMQLYFEDPSMVPVFVHENYLKPSPANLKFKKRGMEKDIHQLYIIERAAAALSDGDLVDSVIHGSESQWGLMPFHAISSTVTPASFTYGAYNNSPMTFPKWFGHNSKQQKLERRLVDMRLGMRLKVSSDKADFRLWYVPHLFPHIVKPLVVEGRTAVRDVIEWMDEYALTEEDWETIVELGLVNKIEDEVKITVTTRREFMRRYNKSNHPVWFHKAEHIGGDDVEEHLVDQDVLNDKLIQVPKKRKSRKRS